MGIRCLLRGPPRSSDLLGPARSTRAVRVLDQTSLMPPVRGGSHMHEARSLGHCREQMACKREEGR